MLERYKRYFKSIFRFIFFLCLFMGIFFVAALAPLFLKGWVSSGAGANTMLFCSFVSLPVAFLALGDWQKNFVLHFYLLGVGVVLGFLIYWDANLNPVKDLANSFFTAWFWVYLLGFFFRFFRNKKGASSTCQPVKRVK